MLQELEDVCRALDKVTKDDAEHVDSHINRRIKSVLHAQIIDVLYKEDARSEDGGNDPDNIILMPLSSLADGMREEAKPLPINKNSKGL